MSAKAKISFEPYTNSQNIYLKNNSLNNNSLIYKMYRIIFEINVLIICVGFKMQFLIDHYYKKLSEFSDDLKKSE